jgi:kynureninase
MPQAAATFEYRADEGFAREMDARDPLREFRGLFHIPTAACVGGEASKPALYFTGNSLGLMPKAAGPAVEQELKDWRELAVEAHLHGKTPWLSYHEVFREMGARLVGGVPGEVVMMNSLTVNLHLLMVSFYRPTRERYRIVVEDALFPSDSYAVASQARFHGLDPADAVVRLKPRSGEQTLRTEDIEAKLREIGGSVALVMLGGVNYLTGQWFDMERITRTGHDVGAVVGWDLAHAAGNVPMRLHDWGVDFAAWCSYKYLNAGPGAVAGAFVHEKHGKKPPLGERGHQGQEALPRFAGWWGNDPATRFAMRPEFVAREGADGWQLSNPPIMAMAPLKASLEIFDRVGMAALREKSLKLTGYLEYLLDRLGDRVRIITPRHPGQRGCHLSLSFRGDAKRVLDSLKREGVVCDFREPDVIRAAPAPLYNTFEDVWRFAGVLGRVLG